MLRVPSPSHMELPLPASLHGSSPLCVIRPAVCFALTCSSSRVFHPQTPSYRPLAPPVPFHQLTSPPCNLGLKFISLNLPSHHMMSIVYMKRSSNTPLSRITCRQPGGNYPWPTPPSAPHLHLPHAHLLSSLTSDVALMEDSNSKAVVLLFTPYNPLWTVPSPLLHLPCRCPTPLATLQLMVTAPPIKAHEADVAPLSLPHLTPYAPAHPPPPYIPGLRQSPLPPWVPHLLLPVPGPRVGGTWPWGGLSQA